MRLRHAPSAPLPGPRGATSARPSPAPPKGAGTVRQPGVRSCAPGGTSCTTKVVAQPGPAVPMAPVPAIDIVVVGQDEGTYVGRALAHGGDDPHRRHCLTGVGVPRLCIGNERPGRAPIRVIAHGP